MSSRAREIWELSDAELRRRCHPWEVLVRASQAAAAPAAGAAVLAASSTILPSLLACMAAAPAVAAGMVVWEAIEALHRVLPSAPCRDELALRRWQLGLLPNEGAKQQQRWAQRLLAHEHAPDWLFVLDAPATPSRERRWVRVDVKLRGRGPAPFRISAAGQVTVRRGVALHAEVSQRLLRVEEAEALLQRGEEILTGETRALEGPRRGCDGGYGILVARKEPRQALWIECAPEPSLQEEAAADRGVGELLAQMVSS